MARKPRKKDILNDFRRSELIASARHVFGTHGFESATMEAIARQADVAKGTVYLYYNSKRAICEATLRRRGRTGSGRAEARRGGGHLAVGDCRLRRHSRGTLPGTAGLLSDASDEIGSRVRAPRRRRSLWPRYDRSAARILERLIANAVKRGEIRKVDPRRPRGCVRYDTWTRRVTCYRRNRATRRATWPFSPT